MSNAVSKVFVTGATGFVGKMLCYSLVEKGYLVKGTVRSPEKIALLPQNMEFHMVNEIGPFTEWTEALNGVDTVIHLASRVHVVKETSGDPLKEYRKVNTTGTERLLEMASKAGIRRFIYLSTIKVNGEKTGGHSFSEEDSASPDDPYAQSKWEAEQILLKSAGKTGFEIVIIRPPLIYGPHVLGNFLSLLNWVDKGFPLPLYNVKNLRSLIYLGNLVDAIITCIVHPHAVGETFLVSDGKDISTPDLIRMIASAMRKKARLLPFSPVLLKAIARVVGKGPEIDRLTGSLCIDSSKIRKVLGWKPPFTIEEGIYETVKWYQSNKTIN